MMQADDSLPTIRNSPVPRSQMLGVLSFPLSPPSPKGATHNLDDILASQLASKVELPLKSAENPQLLQEISPVSSLAA